ncbi:unnamed protein product [Didymodactylos carnosus]|uniref:BSD domain-containing protein n=1 Tax=Didymodactylos carnosus TaxID=1234261 RepID=A0A813VKU0_9BILA|nr:unnamed protein product [Didymodactylos carnosus]CAF3626173.1 unnamed protein product [Didymodactylos carnosus]
MSWFNSVIQSAKEKSLHALEFVKNDINEFTTTVKSDTEKYVSQATTVVKNQQVGDLGLKKIVNRLSDVVQNTNLLNKTNTTDLSSTPDRVQIELNKIQTDETVYLNDPVPYDLYEQWKSNLASNSDIDSKKGEISQLLIDNPTIRSIYSRLVPAKTTHTDFWMRYFYRVYQIEEDEIRRLNNLKRAQQMINGDNRNDEADWDEEEDWSPASILGNTSVVKSKSTTDSVPQSSLIIPMANVDREEHGESAQQTSNTQISDIVITEEIREQEPVVSTVEIHEENISKQQTDIPSPIISTIEQPQIDIETTKQEENKIDEHIPLESVKKKDSDTSDSWQQEFLDELLSTTEDNTESEQKLDEVLTRRDQPLAQESETSPQIVSITTDESTVKKSRSKTKDDFDVEGDEWENWA